MTTVRGVLGGTRYYLTYLGVALPLTVLWRLYVAEELAAHDPYLFLLLHASGLTAAAFVGSGTATWWTRRSPRRRWGAW